MVPLSNTTAGPRDLPRNLPTLLSVLLRVRYILDRLFGPRSRADELFQLRRRLAVAVGPGVVSSAEKMLAHRLRELRKELAAQLGHVRTCGRCLQSPAADWPGGQCCSAKTHELFSDHELAALRLSGTTPARLRPPPGGHRGCVFRAASGCSLNVEDRPSVCVDYACRELLVELERRGDGVAYACKQDELRATFRRFVAERTDRIETALFDDLKTGLLDHERRRALSRKLQAGDGASDSNARGRRASTSPTSSEGLP